MHVFRPLSADREVADRLFEGEEAVLHVIERIPGLTGSAGSCRLYPSDLGGSPTVSTGRGITEDRRRRLSAPPSLGYHTRSLFLRPEASKGWAESSAFATT